MLAPIFNRRCGQGGQHCQIREQKRTAQRRADKITGARAAPGKASSKRAKPRNRDGKEADSNAARTQGDGGGGESRLGGYSEDAF